MNDIVLSKRRTLIAAAACATALHAKDALAQAWTPGQILASTDTRCSRAMQAAATHSGPSSPAAILPGPSCFGRPTFTST
ncbi:MAG TPA: hypothetical protein VM491_01580 [Burkholderiaceae bacterium]|nr:hypothetical protein [Burkholderiaceae bacterium]